MTPSLPAATQRLQFRPLEMGDVDELVALHEDPLVAREKPIRSDRLLGEDVTVYAISGADRFA
jgi:hypothetical protein